MSPNVPEPHVDSRRLGSASWIRRPVSGLCPGRRPRAPAARLRRCLQPRRFRRYSMNRQNLFADSPWDGESEETGTRHRVFWRPDNARMGATMWELAAGAPGGRLHMHYGAEEMVFVVSGRPVFPNATTQDE